jgi:hypothetical protein
MLHIQYFSVENLASAAYTVYGGIHGLGAVELHFQIVDLIADFHILEHIASQLAFQAANLLLQCFFGGLGTFHNSRFLFC